MSPIEKPNIAVRHVREGVSKLQKRLVSDRVGFVNHAVVVFVLLDDHIDVVGGRERGGGDDDLDDVCGISVLPLRLY